ncbi:MAG: acyl-CoA reductase, partial [Arenibacter algicola]|nr:acyl-CoA reductase [Arenibacter algicola]
MQIQRKVEILSRLGEFFMKAAGHEAEVDELLNPSIVRLKDAVETAHHHNGWFSPEAVKQALTAWGESLNTADVEAWLKSYSFEGKSQKVGVIMAGNIPLVGLHDALCVLLNEHELHAKLSSKDSLLMPVVLETIAAIAPEWKAKIKVVDQLKNIDALIATGSDNSARYFDYYFRGKKKLIRKNRTSVALLNNSESEEELAALAEDIFTYYGLGCRNVTKLFLPKDYNLDQLFKAFFPYQDIVNHNKYANNYDYNKAVYLLNKIELIE